MSLSAFLVVAVVVIVTPGPDTALTIRNTLLGGRRAGVVTAAGIAAGQATWTVATAAGLAAVLAASEPVYRTVRLVGAAYLIFLGLQTVLAARRGGDAPGPRPPRGRLGARTAVRQGLVSNLTNPKMAAFFPALLPQFAPAGAVVELLALGLLFAALTLAWLAGYAATVARASDVLRRPRVRRWLEAVTGTVLVALGLRVAAGRPGP